MALVSKKIAFLKNEKVKILSAVTVVTSVISAPYIINFWGYNISDNTQDWGGFGSYIGGLLSPILAIGSLYYVVKTFRQQSFENTFNLLLEQHNTLAEKISSETVGKESIIQEKLGALGISWLIDQASSRKTINESYEIHQYLRVVYQVLMFIDESCPSDQRKYSRIFRSFLSNDLIYMVALNGAQRNNNEEKSFTFPKYKLFIEKYGFLEHLIFKTNAISKAVQESHKLTDMFSLVKCYELSAFGDGSNITTSINSVGEDYLKRLNYKIDKINKNMKSHTQKTDFILNDYPKLLDDLKRYLETNSHPSKEALDINQKAHGLFTTSISLLPTKKVTQENIETGKGLESTYNNSINVNLKHLKDDLHLLNLYSSLLNDLKTVPTLSRNNVSTIENLQRRIQLLEKQCLKDKVD
ncbi:putative phage abortive infection protein [Vibrio crassostreae]|nr:putative phage abortive infection protein [Vibrio crassostreae]